MDNQSTLPNKNTLFGYEDWLFQLDEQAKDLSIDDCLNELNHAIYYTEQTHSLTYAGIAINYYLAVLEKLEKMSTAECESLEQHLMSLLPDGWLMWVQTWEDWFVENKRPACCH